MAVRISNIDIATATVIITEVLNSTADNPILESNADNIQLTWPGTSPWEEDYWYWWYCCHHDGAMKPGPKPGGPMSQFFRLLLTALTRIIIVHLSECLTLRVNLP